MTRQGIKERHWFKALASFPLVLTISTVAYPAVARTAWPHTGTRNIYAKRVTLCPGICVHVQALRIQIPCPFVISNKSSSLRTQHSKKIIFSLCLTEVHFSNDNMCQELAVFAGKQISALCIEGRHSPPISSRMCSNHSEWTYSVLFKRKKK